MLSSAPKVKVTFYLSKGVKDEFYDLVKQKHKNMWGVSWEAEEALRAWLRTHKQAQGQLEAIKVNPSYPHVHTIMDQIIQTLKTEYYCLNQCDLATLRKAIGVVRGSDERTIKKWTNQLLAEKKIKWLRPSIFEIV